MNHFNTVVHYVSYICNPNIEIQWVKSEQLIAGKKKKTPACLVECRQTDRQTYGRTDG